MLKSILLTGAAGLIGGDVAGRLTAAGHRVTGLVHRNPEVRDNLRVAVPIPTIMGDVSRPRFGWDEAMWDTVARDHDLLIHCAATVRFDLAEAAYCAVNVTGTAEALALAEAGKMALLHISTAYVCGLRDGPISEGDPICGNGFANGYEASKAQAEALVRASTARWAIARPSIVVGDSASGAIRSFDTIYAAFRLIAEGRISTMPASPGATLDFVPIDHVTRGIVAIAECMEQAASGTYHLASGHPMPIGTFTAAIATYPQFSAPLLANPADFDPSLLPAPERRLYTRVAGLYASYFQRDPRFDDSRLRALTGLSCPPTDAAFLRRLIDHCVARGFLSGARETQRISG